MANYHYKKKVFPTYKRDTFGAKIILDTQSGGKRLQLTSPMWYQTILSRYQEGTNVTLQLLFKSPRRTEQQNRYYWGVYLPLIAKETGENDLPALHELFKSEFLTTEVRRVLGKDVRLSKSTTELSVGEFCEYILSIDNRTGVLAPPTENYDMAPLRVDPGAKNV